jgi:hypothetical protein
MLDASLWYHRRYHEDLGCLDDRLASPTPSAHGFEGFGLSGTYGQPAPGAGARTVSTCPVRSRSCMLAGPLHFWSTMNSVLLSAPPSMHAKQPRSSTIVCSTSPPSLTRTHRLLGTSAYQTAPSASLVGSAAGYRSAVVHALLKLERERPRYVVQGVAERGQVGGGDAIGAGCDGDGAHRRLPSPHPHERHVLA